MVRRDGIKAFDLLKEILFVFGRKTASARLDQHAHKRKKKEMILWRQRKTERINGEFLPRRIQGHVAAAKELGEPLVTAAKVKDVGLRRVFLEVRNQEIEEKALAASRLSQDECVGNILVVEIEKVRRPARRFKKREILLAELLVSHCS